MSVPAWQRARIRPRAGIPAGVHMDELAMGRALWVRIERPRMYEGTHWRLDGVPFTPVFPCYETNILGRNQPGKAMLVTAVAVELLPEFAEEVVMMSFAEWMGEGGGARQ